VPNKTLRIEFTGAIADRETAVQRSGRLEGGGRVTFDVSESEMHALAALMPLARVPLRITVEVDSEPRLQQETKKGAPEGGAKEKPQWAQERSKIKRSRV
jgi:hypothetical protein